MTTENPEQKPATESKPWGDDFDEEKAWALIQNLRGDKAALKGRVDELEKAEQARADSEKTEAQKAADEAEKARKELADARRELFVARAIAKHPGAADFEDFLTGDTEEEILAKAERLSKVTPAGSAEKEKEAEKAADLPAKPKPNLTPGHGGGDSTALDLDALVSNARAGR